MKTTKQDLNKTLYVPQSELQKRRKRYIIDAANRTVGDVATLASTHLIGKHKPHYRGAWDAGDFVVITNARDIKVTGRKFYQKEYYKHTGYRGHLKVSRYENVVVEKPDFIIEHAIYGMIPKNTLRKGRMKRCKILLDDDTSRYTNFTLHTLS